MQWNYPNPASLSLPPSSHLLGSADVAGAAPSFGRRTSDSPAPPTASAPPDTRQTQKAPRAFAVSSFPNINAQNFPPMHFLKKNSNETVAYHFVLDQGFLMIGHPSAVFFPLQIPLE